MSIGIIVLKQVAWCTNHHYKRQCAGDGVTDQSDHSPLCRLLGVVTPHHLYCPQTQLTPWPPPAHPPPVTPDLVSPQGPVLPVMGKYSFNT